MSHPQYVKSGICENYQTLLDECGKALMIWDGYRAKVTQSGPAGTEEGKEIFRLQAKYARAYTALQKHLEHCVLCRLIARFDGSQSSDATTVYGEARH
ncbi:MAG: hypothetical protein NVS9B14_01150 [Candidatus Acidiferrum sp.]